VVSFFVRNFQKLFLDIRPHSADALMQLALAAQIPFPGIPDVYIGQEMRVAPIDRPWDTSSRSRISRFRGCAAYVYELPLHSHLNLRAIKLKFVGLFKVIPNIRAVCIDIF